MLRPEFLKRIFGLLLILLICGGALFGLFGTEHWGLPSPMISSTPSVVAESQKTLPPSEEAGSLPTASPIEEDQDSIVAFAHSQAGIMQEALESETAATAVFTKLETCVNSASGQITNQERLICLANAKRLAEDYSEKLGARFNRLGSQHPQLIGTLEATGL